MKIRILSIFILIVLVLSCGQSKHSPYQGYVEAEPIFLASPFSGVLLEKLVDRGQSVKKGELLFRLDDNPESFLIKEREAQLSQAKKIHQDLKNPRRPYEIDAIRAQIKQVDAQLELADLRVQRYQELYEKQASNKDNLDAALARHHELQYLKAQYQSNLELARLGSREEQIKAQQAKIDALTAQLNRAKWQLQQKRILAPADGIIWDTYYREGEFVGSQQAVLSLLTPDNVRIEFFIPVETLSRLHLRQKIFFSCDGCDKTYQAMVTYISPEVEYIPPLVYSRENRDKLVFRVQAALKNPQAFKPGQPVSITEIEHEP